MSVPDKKMSLTVKVVIGMLLGIILGLALNYSGVTGMQPNGSFPETFAQEYLVDGFFALIGSLFVNALKMLVVPLVLFSLICGVCGIGDIRYLGRVGGKSFALYLLTTAIAISAALSIAVFFDIGSGMAADKVDTLKTIAQSNPVAIAEAPSLISVITNIVPKNPIQAMANGEMLQVIFFALILGVAILKAGSKADSLVKGIESANEAMMQMVNIIMSLAPYAVLALIARSVANLGLDLLTEIAGYFFVLVFCLLFHLFVVQTTFLKVLTGLNVRRFLNKAKTIQAFAFSTSSSNATIPVTLKTVTQRMGVNKSIASFSVPFGATINMDGTAIMQGVATVFIANLYGIDLGLMGYLTVVIMAVLASVGTAGVPGVGLIMLSMVFSQVGIPIEGIGLILGIDRILDMIRTAVNVTGDAMVSVVVAKSEGKLDENIFNDDNAGIIVEDAHVKA